MEKQIYNKPCLKLLLFVEEPVLGNGTYHEIDPSEPGEDLSKEGTLDNSEFHNSLDNPNFPTRFKSVWDEE